MVLAVAMDPTVQVALVSILGILITTSGVVVVALINNRRERTGAASAGVEAGLDEKDVLGRMLALITENETLKATNEGLKRQVALLVEENFALREESAAKEEEP